MSLRVENGHPTCFISSLWTFCTSPLTRFAKAVLSLLFSPSSKKLEQKAELLTSKISEPNCSAEDMNDWVAVQLRLYADR